MAGSVVYVAAGTTDVQAVTGSCTLVGYSAVAAGAATVAFHDGTSTSGTKVVADSFSGAGQKVVTLPAVPFATGIFLDRATANIELMLYLA